ncbi:hypothetical protein ABLG96_02680 [Nakamurella sp. A5-74]|uniref:Uncharacterized protein n=1 Tax=Nakamurella sp. A5-74 TaxID=3158264 RepID=A0AAU8DQK2_9ACTN
MTDYLVYPEIAGGFGDNAELDTTSTPPTVTRLHYEIETWMGGELLRTYPVYVATDRFVEMVTANGLTGFATDTAEVTVSEQGREFMIEKGKSTDIPHFQWFKVVGTRGRDDFSTVAGRDLVVSQRALDVIRPLLGPDHDIERTDQPR